MEVKFNINNTVRLKLTEYGYTVWQNDYNKSGLLARDEMLTIEDLKKKEEQDGFITMQLHEVMNIFGPKLYNGSRQVIVDNSIYFHISKE